MNGSKVFNTMKKMEQEDLEQRKVGVERDKRWRSIPEIAGKFLYQMVMTQRPQIIVEIGMSQGYSTLWMALACSTYGGKIHAYEIEDWRYQQACQNIADAGLEGTIKPHLVDTQFTEYPESIDLVFIDAEKSDYIDHYKNVAAKLSDNAVVLADNVLSHVEELNPYREFLQSKEDIFTVTIPIGKGIEFSRKLQTTEANWHDY